MQSQDTVQVFVVRSGFIENPVRIRWGVIRDEADTDLPLHYCNMRGELLFTKTDSDQHKVINFTPYHYPLASSETFLSLAFTEVTTEPIVREYMPLVKPYKAHGLTIHNNIPRPIVQFTFKKITCMQSEKVVSVPIERRYRVLASLRF